MNVFDYLLEGKPDDATALLTLKRQHTYGEVRSNALAVAAFLARAGATKGQRAILIADSGLFWVAAYLGIMRAGLVCVPLPPRLAAEELEYVAAVTDPAFVFMETKYALALPEKFSNVPLICDDPHPSVPAAQSLASIRQSGAGSNDPLPELAQDDLAALMFTSGSTGRPRGVMVSHRNIIANTNSIIDYLELTADDRIMAVLPFHYCFGASLLHTHLKAGGSVVIDSRFMYPEKVLQRMQQTACTGFAGVPSHFQILLRKSSLAKMSFPHLRYVQQAGGQLAPAFITELRQALPRTQVFVMYGQTEATARLSYLPPELLGAKLGSVGKGIPGVTLSVVDESGNRILQGQTGEIVAEGGNLALGYWRDAEETAHHFRNGKLYTGDLATVDEDGFIFIVDRAKDFLKCGGKRVSCRNLENILLEHAALLEAAVVGIPDEILGEAAVAYIVPRDPKTQPSREQLTTFCRERMPLPVVPRRFVVLGSLPKNSSGKVLKGLLKDADVVARGTGMSEPGERVPR
jgi:acyl-CoA synthetase (AMP-forming)/AMP-acid ligase II